jgi:hypothetical protein
VFQRRPRNTYQLEPKKKFQPEPVYRILQHVVTHGLHNVFYDPEVIPELCMKMTADIRTRVKALNFDRWG